MIILSTAVSFNWRSSQAIATTSHHHPQHQHLPTSETKNTHSADVFKTQLAKSKSQTMHVLINGGVHANEKYSPVFVKWLKERYNSKRSILNKLPFDASFDFVPLMNTSGYKNQNRLNSNQVNLNRNFPVLWGMSKENPGKAPASEIETKKLMNLFQKRSYDLAIDVHGYVNWIVLPSSPKLLESLTKMKVSSKESQIYLEWKKETKKNMSILGRYDLKTAGGLGDGGSFEDYAFWGEGVLSLCLEMTRDVFSDEKRLSNFLTYEKFIHASILSAYKLKGTNNKLLVDRAQ